jgi:hypothetical protein
MREEAFEILSTTSTQTEMLAIQLPLVGIHQLIGIRNDLLIFQMLVLEPEGGPNAQRFTRR